MKLVIITLIFQFLSILIFTLIYLSFNKEFVKHSSYFIKDINHNTEKNELPTLLDCLFLATTVQVSVGYSIIYPVTEIAKCIMILQQFFMICSNSFIIYTFIL